MKPGTSLSELTTTLELLGILAQTTLLEKVLSF